MVDVKGVVLCGGQGKRLRPLTYYFQKTMVPIPPHQKPLLEYIIMLMKHHGIREIVLLVDYKWEQIANYFGDGGRFGVKLSYVWDNPQYKGNGGALYNAFIEEAFSEDNTILIYYGDILSNINLSNLLDFHRRKGSSATLALSKNFRVNVGVAELDGDKVIGLREKPPLNKPVTIGVLTIEGSTMDTLGEIVKSKGQADIMGDFIPRLIELGKPVYAYLTDAFWYDVGSTESYEKLDPDIVEKELSFLVKGFQIKPPGRA